MLVTAQSVPNARIVARTSQECTTISAALYHWCPHEAMAVRLVDARPSVEEPTVVLLHKDRVRLVGEGRADPVFVLADADPALR